ncbi:hypothetical protein K431DRAFT_101205 [Polychaeton citri CBS 116435]|uniref:BTB domain-containing protein n=1 Tax=Polychaeton citri CBS 116435 TaxID=1314669 RepID=A0A9P4QI76_9PEZI|nr:hypothetical protein K431DRAFT_101205 [Polychaeton citri CBS 116435]
MPSRRDHYEFMYGRQFGPAPPPVVKPQESIFPYFLDGDTQIIVSGARQFKLHSSVLCRGSPYFARLLTTDSASSLSKIALKKGVTTRYRLVLQRPDDDGSFVGSDDLDHINFKLVELNDQGNPISRDPMPLDIYNGRKVPEYYDHIEQVLAAMYGKPLDIGAADDPDGIRPIITKAVGVKKVAEDLECIGIVTKPIEAALLACSQSLWCAIAQDPVIWLSFASDIQSRPLFREAMIHAAGKYRTERVREFIANRPLNPYASRPFDRALARPSDPLLDEAVVKLLVKKAETLINQAQEAELKIGTHYPTHMQREKTLGHADRDSIGRASYANDIYGWMALAVYRQFINQALALGRTYCAEDLGFTYFRCIAAGGNEYLDRESLRAFHERFPMSGKGVAVVETKLNEIKNNVKVFVQSLLKNNSQLDTERYPVSHMTCCTVEPEEYPWL